MTMMGILQVASYIYKRYMDDFGVRIDEMKLQIWVKLRIKEEGGGLWHTLFFVKQLFFIL